MTNQKTIKAWAVIQTGMLNCCGRYEIYEKYSQAKFEVDPKEGEKIVEIEIKIK